MTYRFLNSSLSVSGKNPKETLSSDFQGALNKEFKTSSDWFVIQREFPYGSSEYIDVEARVNRVFDGKTTVTIADDFKRLLFRTPEDAPQLGSLYYFDDNYWMVTNTEAIKSLATTCVVRRCNNVLRWRDFNNGAIYSVPCVIDYLIKETRDYSTGGGSLVQPSGFAEIIVQFNPDTNKIRPSRRFLFGNQDNWMAYKVMGGGINNYDNRITTNMTSAGLLRISTLANQANEDTDDLVNGIADAKEYNYSLSLNQNSQTITIGDSYTLIATVEMNGDTVSKPVVWESGSISIATISQSGIITPVGVGTTTIRCSMQDNLSVYDECVLVVSGAPSSNYMIALSPNIDGLFEGTEQTFTVTLSLNGVPQPDSFTFSLNSGSISIDNYRYNVLSGTSFWIKNLKRYDGDQLVVTATSGVHSMQIPIKLRGAW